MPGTVHAGHETVKLLALLELITQKYGITMSKDTQNLGFTIHGPISILPSPWPNLATLPLLQEGQDARDWGSAAGPPLLPHTWHRPMATM